MIELFEHNRIAYEKVEKMFLTKNRCAVVHPTGTGKTYIAFKLVIEHSDKHFCWLSPSKYIYGHQCRSLMRSTGRKEKKDLKKILKGIEFHTYAWLSENVEIIPEIRPDYIILDEFHRCGASVWGETVTALMDHYPDAKVLGLSATNVRYLDNARDMAEEIFGGNIASSMMLGEAMAKNILPVPQYIVSVYLTEKELQNYQNGTETLRNNNARTQAQYVLQQIRRSVSQAKGLPALFQKYTSEKGKYIVFCSDFDHLSELMNKFRVWFQESDPEIHTYYAYSYSGDTKGNIKDFSNDSSDHYRFLFCINMLNEGIHFPDVDGVIMFRTTASPIIYKQQIGRALSVTGRKVPKIFDLVNNHESLISVYNLRDEYESAWEDMGDYSDAQDYQVPASFTIIDETLDVMELLKKLNGYLDSTWEDYFGFLQDYVRKFGHANVVVKYVNEEGIRLGIWLANQKKRYREDNSYLSEERLRRLTELGVDMSRVSDVIFDTAIRSLLRYKEEYGDLLVPSGYRTPEGFSLAAWVANTRKRYIRGILAEERIRELESMGFIWNVAEHRWEETFRRVKEYYEKTGSLAGMECGKEDREPLYSWLVKQREAYHKGTLSLKRIQKLESVGMCWNTAEAKFSLYYEAAVRYRKEHGHLNITSDYETETGLKLGAWLNRKKNLNSRGKLDAVTKEKLEALGMNWTMVTEIWEEKYRKVKDYAEKHGEIDSIEDEELARWIHFQKVWLKTDNPDKPEFFEKRKRLEEIGISRKRLDEDRFEKYYMIATVYFQNHGNLLVPRQYKLSGYLLGEWICNLRNAYRSGERIDGVVLDTDKINRLNSIGMVWLSPSDWECMYEYAKAHYEKYGNLDMGINYSVRGLSLGKWVREQRKLVIEGTLAQDRKLLLEKIGMDMP